MGERPPVEVDRPDDVGVLRLHDREEVVHAGAHRVPQLRRPALVQLPRQPLERPPLRLAAAGAIDQGVPQHPVEPRHDAFVALRQAALERPRVRRLERLLGVRPVAQAPLEEGEEGALPDDEQALEPLPVPGHHAGVHVRAPVRHGDACRRSAGPRATGAAGVTARVPDGPRRRPCAPENARGAGPAAHRDRPGHGVPSPVAEDRGRALGNGEISRIEPVRRCGPRAAVGAGRTPRRPRASHSPAGTEVTMIRRILFTTAAAAALLAAAPAFAADDAASHSHSQCSCCSDGSNHATDHALREGNKKRVERAAQPKTEEDPFVRNMSYGG
jgi:hypothetical protein